MESERKLKQPAWVFGTGKQISVECGGGDWRVSECGRKQVVCHGVCILCPPTNVGEVAVVEVDCSSRAGGANRRSALAP